MFSQKKSFFRRKIFYLFLAGIFGFGYFINNSQEILPGGDEINTNISKPVEAIKRPVADNGKGDADAISQSDEQSDIPQALKAGESYYLVKEVEGIIKIFFYNEAGEEHLVDATDIAFSLIGEEDQQLFSKGIIIKSEEELQSLLQDFES